MHRNHRRKARHFKRHAPPGSVPGTIHVAPDALHSSIVAYSYDPQECEQVVTSEIDKLQSLRGKRDVFWINVVGLGDANVIRRIGEAFGLHPLALEDVVNVHQKVKVEDYRDHLFIVSRFPGATSESEQLSIFLGDNFVITFQERPHDLLDVVVSRMTESIGQVRKQGADYLVYAILDTVLDAYFPLVEEFGKQLDGVEDLITDRPPQGTMHRIHEMRRIVRSTRQVIWSHREAMNMLLRDPTTLIRSETRIYLRDCHDHTIQLVDLLEIYRENCTDLRDVYLSTVSNRMNEIMTVLTVMASIFIPLSFITGLYGMNFDTDVSPWNMPELKWFFGYPFALSLMAGVAIGLLVLFRIRGWINSYPDRSHDIT